MLEKTKSDGEGQASQIKEYLGFKINTREMVVNLPEGKKQQLKLDIEKILLCGTKQWLSVRELAKALGTMIAAEPALGNMPLMAARAGYIQIDECVSEYGWERSLRLNEETLAGLKFFLDNIDQFDGTPICSAENDVSVISIIGPPSEFMKKLFVKNHVRTEKDEIWASDASGFATCGYSVGSNHLLGAADGRRAEVFLRSQRIASCEAYFGVLQAQHIKAGPFQHLLVDGQRKLSQFPHQRFREGAHPRRSFSGHAVQSETTGKDYPHSPS